MSGPAPNKFRTVQAADDVIIAANPNFTYPQSFTPASDSLFDHLRAVDTTINGFQAEAAAIYVDGTNGLDTNAGDELHPVLTITRAIVLATAAGGAGRIVVSSGTYIEGDLTLPNNWDLEGRSLDAIIAPAAPAIIDVVNMAGAIGNMVSNITLQPAAGAIGLVAAFNINGLGTYRIINCQVIAPAAAVAMAGIQAQGGALVEVFSSIINNGAAAHIGPGINIGIVNTSVILTDTEVTSNVDCTVDVGTLELRSTRVTNNNAAGNDGVITLTGAADLLVIDSTLNNVAPGAGPNGYTINWAAGASAITLNNAKLQNNGTYVNAGVTILPEGAGGEPVINNLGFYAPSGDLNFGAAGISGFTNGVSPKLFEGINSGLWATVGSGTAGATPFAAADEFDQWSAIMRIARGLDALINTVATGAAAGGGVALGAYTGGQIP